MYIALLIDEKDEPVGLRIDPRDLDRSKPFLTWASVGQQPRSFKLVREEADLGNDEKLLSFRLATGSISDQHFEHVAAAEKDKYVNPGKYADRVLYPEMFKRPALPISGQSIPAR